MAKENERFKVAVLESEQIKSKILEVADKLKVDVEDGVDTPLSVLNKVSETQSGTGIDRLQWKCDNVKSLKYEFSGYTGESLSEVLVGLDTSKVTDMTYSFYNCENITEISQIDTSNVVNMSRAFYGCKKLISLPMLNTSKVTNMSYMLGGCWKSIELPLWDTSNVTDMSYMCTNAGNIILPQLNTSKVTNMTYMFYNSQVKNVPSFDTGNVTNMSYMLYGCRDLLAVPNMNTSKVTNMHNMLYVCTSITEIPELDTANVLSFSYFACGCTNLISVKKLDMIKVVNNSNATSMFSSCTNLTNLNLLNIKVNLAIGSGTSYGTLLTLDSLINTIQQLWDYSSGTTTYKLTMSTPSKQLIANTYVRLITPTQEQIDADPYINNKMPCEVCESTDEGAMLITDYATLKRWSIS